MAKKAYVKIVHEPSLLLAVCGVLLAALMVMNIVAIESVKRAVEGHREAVGSLNETVIEVIEMGRKAGL